MKTIKELRKHIRADETNREELLTLSVSALQAFEYYITARCVTEYGKRMQDHIAAQKVRAAACRYNHMANAIVGKEDFIYHSDFGMAGEFGLWDFEDIKFAEELGGAK